MSSKKSNQKPPTRPAKLNHRSTLSLSKTDIIINCYDLLPPGKLASLLWTFGTSLLHSGVVINDREYAFGGHDKRGLTGVYWTRPRMVPPGGTFKCEMLQGFTVSSQTEIDRIIHAASEEFQGTSYNLLTRNCNHFTAYLCEKLTGRPSPGWLNRASSIGVALPCLLPKEWIAPPDFESAEGELLVDDEEDVRGGGRGAGERTSMLASTDSSQRHSIDDGRVDLLGDWDSDRERRKKLRKDGKGKGQGAVRDTSGRVVPRAERAPLPHK